MRRKTDQGKETNASRRDVPGRAAKGQNSQALRPPPGHAWGANCYVF